MNNLNSLFVVFVLLAIMACGNVDSSKTVNENTDSISCTNKGEPGLSDNSCCAVKKEDEESKDLDCH